MSGARRVAHSLLPYGQDYFKSKIIAGVAMRRDGLANAIQTNRGKQ
jgi:hypothetical protein